MCGITKQKTAPLPFVSIPKSGSDPIAIYSEAGSTAVLPAPWLSPITRKEPVPLRAVFYVFSGVVSLFLGALQLLMFARAIFSWLPVDEDSPIPMFLHAVTEPFILPVRAILERFEFFASSPIDLSFFVTFLLLSALQSLL
ncbi:MAG: YggT family protein [Ruminococcaceae bacterium]|nr:YggT family protein [Oscillospiraceae bacterium]